LKKSPSQKRAGGVTQGVGPEFKPQYHKKKKKEEKEKSLKIFKDLAMPTSCVLGLGQEGSGIL
jgi:hypothetical protein